MQLILLTCVMPTRKSPFTELVPFSMSLLTRRKPAPRRRKPLDTSSITSSKVTGREAAAGETGTQTNKKPTAVQGEQTYRTTCEQARFWGQALCI